MNFLVMLLTTLFLFSCSAPTAPTSQTLTFEVKYPSAAPHIPGAAQPLYGLKWDKQKPVSAEFAAVLDTLKTPDETAKYMQANIEWKDGYDTTHFLDAETVFKQRYAVCSGLARFSQLANQRQGRRSIFFAVWGRTSAHAITLVKVEGNYHIFSNQYFYAEPIKTDEEGLRSVFKKAAAEFYGAEWTEYIAYEEGGVIVDYYRNPAAPVLSPIPMAPDRNVFTIRK